MILEPCCYEKQLTDTIRNIKDKGDVAQLYTNSDVDLNMLMPFFLSRTPFGVMTLVMPTIEQNALETLRKMLVRLQFDNTNGETKKLVTRCVLITSGQNRKEVLAALREIDDRLIVCEDNVGFRCLTCSDGVNYFTLHGSINQRMLTATQLMTLTTSKRLYEETMQVLSSKGRVKAIRDWKEKYEQMTKE